MASSQLEVVTGKEVSPVVSRSVGNRPRPDGGDREAAVVKKINGEGDGSLGVNQCCFVFGVHTPHIHMHIYLFIYFVLLK